MKTVFKITSIVVLFFIAFFWIAGKVGWTRGWLFAALLAIGQGASAIYIWKRDPALLKRRGEMGEGVKTWDKILLGLFGLTYSAILVLAALDERYGWSEMSGWLWLTGVMMYLFFVVVLTWAMAVNTHFEKFVRIQEDRGHRVIETGPYGIIRHPGYLATIVGFVLATPLLLGSWWSFIPAFLAVFCLVVRTALEDRVLHKELAGYKEYAHRVRYRLLIGVW